MKSKYTNSEVFDRLWALALGHAGRWGVAPEVVEPEVLLWLREYERLEHVCVALSDRRDVHSWSVSVVGSCWDLPAQAVESSVSASRLSVCRESDRGLVPAAARA